MTRKTVSPRRSVSAIRGAAFDLRERVLSSVSREFPDELPLTGKHRVIGNAVSASYGPGALTIRFSTVLPRFPTIDESYLDQVGSRHDEERQFSYGALEPALTTELVYDTEELYDTNAALEREPADRLPLVEPAEIHIRPSFVGLIERDATTYASTRQDLRRGLNAVRLADAKELTFLVHDIAAYALDALAVPAPYWRLENDTTVYSTTFTRNSSTRWTMPLKPGQEPLRDVALLQLATAASRGVPVFGAERMEELVSYANRVARGIPFGQEASRMMPLHVHPFFQKLGRIPIATASGKTDRSDLELLAIDTHGTKRPEQAYGVINRRNFMHLYVAVSAVGPFLDIQQNRDRVSRDRKPYTFNLSTKKNSLYLRDGLTPSRLFHLVVNRETGLPDKAEILAADVEVEPRYVAPPAWFLAELSALPSEECESLSSVLRAPNGVRLLTLGESSRFKTATLTSSISDALYVLNKLPHAITGAYLADRGIPAVFSYRGRNGESSFSDMPIGPFASAGVTAGVRRYTHRANALQLERAISSNAPESHDTIRDIVHSVRQWSSHKAA